MQKRLISFIKKETVLTVATLLALGSMFLVPPSADYLDYIDFRVLGLLLAMMLVMEGCQEAGIFAYIGDRLLLKIRSVRQMAVMLVMLTFFSAMLITNDVALITFVPFTMYLLKQAEKEELLIPVLILQTMGANLGSMLTPIGNPQNLYLYNVSGYGLMEFMGIMLPYTALAFVCLLLTGLFFPKEEVWAADLMQNRAARAEETGEADNGAAGKPAKQAVLVYIVLFAFCLLVVARVLPWYVALPAVAGVLLVYRRQVFLHVDYCLLLTFVAFFVFIGNIGRIERLSSLLEEMIAGREIPMGIALSQIISNVPATMLLAGFSDRYTELMIGVNLGGLGTLIASMASLISYKLFAHAYNERKGRYLLLFTGANLIGLALYAVELLLLR